MAIARLHDGPLDGQVVPLDTPELDDLILPYGQGQIVYRRRGETQNTGSGDGPTESGFWYVQATDEISPSPDDVDER